MITRDRVNDLQCALADGGENMFNLAPAILRNIIRSRDWVNRRDGKGQPFGEDGFERFVTHILWHGLETTIDDLLLACRNEEAKDVREAILELVPKARKQGRPSIDDLPEKGSVTTFIGRGQTYTLRRLKRDHPDLAERVVKGELSANAAAIEVGFRRKLTPLEIAQQQIPKLSAEQRGHLTRLLGVEPLAPAPTIPADIVDAILDFEAFKRVRSCRALDEKLGEPFHAVDPFLSKVLAGDRALTLEDIAAWQAQRALGKNVW